MAKKKAKRKAQKTKGKATSRAGAARPRKAKKPRKVANARKVASPQPRAFNHRPKAAQAGRAKPAKVKQSWPVGRRPGDKPFPMHIHYSAKEGFKDSSQLTIGYGPNLKEAIRRVEEVLDRYQRDKEASKYWFQISLSWFDRGEWHSELT